jgi:hypothetical protein
MESTQLPPLPLDEWEPTKDTLHLWTQIIGKTRLALMPMRNHWWNVTLYPSARGLTTRRMPVDVHNLEVELDLIDHRVWARTTESDATFDLYDGLSVADFHQRLGDMLERLDVRVDIRAEPFGVPMTTPFAADHDHASYDTDAVTASSASCNGAPTCSKSSPAGTAARAARCTCSGTASTSPRAGSPAGGPSTDQTSTQ